MLRYLRYQALVGGVGCRHTDESGVLKKPSQADCAEGISAVKALAIAQEQGQKVYTINQSNRDTALPKLSIGGEMGAEIRSAIQAGKEVIFHENRITANGWAGYGYVITDQETGAGGYIIEGRGNGGFLDWWDENGNNVGMALTVTSLVAAAFPLLVSAPLLWGLFFISVFVSVMNYLVNDLKAIENGCPSMGYLALGIEAVALLFGVFKAAGLAIGSYISLVTGGAVGTAVRVCSR